MNCNRELSIDELDSVSGGDFGLDSAIHLESVRLENAPVSPTPPPIGESKASAWAKAGKAKISIR